MLQLLSFKSFNFDNPRASAREERTGIPRPGTLLRVHTVVRAVLAVLTLHMVEGRYVRRRTWRL
jgi:hypothetical protein